MGKLLWKPTPDVMAHSNIARFMDFVNRKHGLSIQDYWQLHQWSIERVPDFWAALWEFAGIVASRSFDNPVDDLDKFPGT